MAKRKTSLDHEKDKYPPIQHSNEVRHTYELQSQEPELFSKSCPQKASSEADKCQLNLNKNMKNTDISTSEMENYHYGPELRPMNKEALTIEDILGLPADHYFSKEMFPKTFWAKQGTGKCKKKI